MYRAFLQRGRALFQQSLDLLFPPQCAGCRRSGSLICPTCWHNMQPLTGTFCLHCGLPLSSPESACFSCQHYCPHLHGLRCVNAYEGALRTAIHALKYRGQRRLAEPLGLLLAAAFRCYNLHADGILPLPLHSQRQSQRGYNQSVLLARVCAEHLKIPCLENLVVRQRATIPQVGLTFHERRHNVAGAFALAPQAERHLARYHHLLLIDDVSTTGSTLEACAEPLYAAGMREVWGLVLSRPTTLAQ